MSKSDQMSDWEDLGKEAVPAACTSDNNNTVPASSTSNNNGTVEFSATLQKAGGISLFSPDPRSTPVDEYLLTLEASVPVESFPWLQKVTSEEVEFWLILDRSGSMSGTPWRQVQTAVLKILDLVRDNGRITVKVMTYNDSAEFVRLSVSDAAAVSVEVRKVNATGSTNFVAVFDLMAEQMRARIEKKQPDVKAKTAKMSFLSRRRSSCAEPRRKLFAFFLTDGCDTCNDAKQILFAKEKMQDVIGKYGEEVIVHVLGFSENHDAAFLESLTQIGTSDGSYSFIAPSDGDEALERRLTDLLESTTGLVGKSVYLDLNVVGDKAKAAFLGDFFGQTVKGIVLHAFMQVKDDTASIRTSKFMRVPSDEKLDLSISLLRELRDDSNAASQIVKCNLKEVNVAPENESDAKALQLRKLRAALNMVTARVGNAMDSTAKQDEVLKELKSYYDIIKTFADKAETLAPTALTTPKSDSEVDDLSKLLEAVRIGLAVCESVLAVREGETGQSRDMRMRGAHAAYTGGSKQAYNMCQMSKVIVAKEGKEKKARSLFQQKQGYLD